MWRYTESIETRHICICQYLMSGGVLPIMAYTWRLRQKGVAFSGFRYMKSVVSVDKKA